MEGYYRICAYCGQTIQVGEDDYGKIEIGHDVTCEQFFLPITQEQDQINLYDIGENKQL